MPQSRWRQRRKNGARCTALDLQYEKNSLAYRSAHMNVTDMAAL